MRCRRGKTPVWCYVCKRAQLILRSEVRYFAKGSIVADSREPAAGLVVITAGQVCEYVCACVVSVSIP